MGKSDKLESPLVAKLKQQGFRAVASISDKNFVPDLLAFVTDVTREKYRGIRMVPPEAALPEGYKWAEERFHIVYAKTKGIHVVLRDVKAPNGDILNYQF